MTEEEARQILELFGDFDEAQLQKQYWAKAKLHEGTPRASDVNNANDLLQKFAVKKERPAHMLPVDANSPVPAIREKNELSIYLADQRRVDERRERKAEAKEMSGSVRSSIVLPSISSRNRFGILSAVALAGLAISKISLPEILTQDLNPLILAEAQVFAGFLGVVFGLLGAMAHLQKTLIEERYKRVETAMNDREFLIAFLQSVGLRTDDDTSFELAVQLYGRLRMDANRRSPSFREIFAIALRHGRSEDPLSLLQRVPDEDVIRMMFKASEALGLVTVSLKEEFGRLTYTYRLASNTKRE